MSENELELDINQDFLRIKNRQVEIDNEIISLKKNIVKYTNWVWGLVAVGAIPFICSIVFFVNHFGNNNNYSEYFLSSTASMWSLAGLFLIYVAFLGQKQQILNQQIEIMYSQLELKHTRIEITEQKEEMKTQNKTLIQQRFDNTFFQLINSFNSIITSLQTTESHETGHDTFKGRHCFFQFHKYLIGKVGYLEDKTLKRYVLKPVDLEFITQLYEKFYEKERSNLSHYFRTLYQIIKLVDTSEIENKYQYTSIVRAQLSSYEQILLFYNCLHENGNKSFKPLIEKYALFKNIDPELLINFEHGYYYEDGAYKYIKEK